MLPLPSDEERQLFLQRALRPYWIAFSVEEVELTQAILRMRWTTHLTLIGLTLGFWLIVPLLSGISRTQLTTFLLVVDWEGRITKQAVRCDHCQGRRWVKRRPFWGRSSFLCDNCAVRVRYRPQFEELQDLLEAGVIAKEELDRKEQDLLIKFRRDFP
jgi:DNA-directed RNA polymerase subunit RPC12/RpoP